MDDEKAFWVKSQVSDEDGGCFSEKENITERPRLWEKKGWAEGILN